MKFLYLYNFLKTTNIVEKAVFIHKESMKKSVVKFGGIKRIQYLCTRKSEIEQSTKIAAGCSAAR